MRDHLAPLVMALMVILVQAAHGQKELEFRIVEENGIPTALNPDHPVPLPDSPKDIIFTESFQIGAREGDPNSIFGAYISFAVDDKGCVYVLDWSEKTVRKFDDSGKFLFSFSGPGQGPGEFSSPTEIRYLPDGHIVVFEDESQKYSCFTKEGELAKTGRFYKLMYPPYFGLTNGNIIAINVVRDPDQSVFVVGIFNGKAELIKPLHQMERKPDPPWPRSGDDEARARRFAQMFSRTAFRRQTVIALNDREDLFFAFTDRYEINLFDKDGELERKIRTELPFLRVEKRDKQEFLGYHLPRDISTWGTMDEALQNRIKNLVEFPEEKPAFLSIIPMENDYLMVVRDGSYRQNALIDIFDPAGRFIIEKKLPFPIKNGICIGEKLFTIHEDEDGNQFVKCYSYKLAQ